MAEPAADSLSWKGRRNDSGSRAGAGPASQPQTKQREQKSLMAHLEAIWRAVWSSTLVMIFSHASGVVAAGHGYGLKGADLPFHTVLPMEELVTQLQHALTHYGAGHSSQHRLLMALLRSNSAGLLLTAVLHLFKKGAAVAGPVFLKLIIQGLAEADACKRSSSAAGASGQDTAEGAQCGQQGTLYLYCMGLFLSVAMVAVCYGHHDYQAYVVGTRMRNALMAVIYRKCLRMPSPTLQAEGTGRVVTLMSNDAQKLQEVVVVLHALWINVIYIIGLVVLLWFQMGWASLLALALLVLLTVALGFIASRLKQLRHSTLVWTDRRVGLMDEAIAGMQMVKFMAWEGPISATVTGARTKEVGCMRAAAMLQGILSMLMNSGHVIVAVACFGADSLAGNRLTLAQAYAALSILNLVRSPLAILPAIINNCNQALVAIKRVADFLDQPDMQAVDGQQQHDPSKDGEGEPGQASMHMACFAWDAAAADHVLHNISFEARPGTLTMVVGSVGSGKSNILHAIMGQLSQRSGTVSVTGKVAYVAQTAWITNDTLQQNVLLGAPLDPVRYKYALKVAQLGPDLELLPHGDQTEIGDRGATMSGGQRQRVALARAVYADADVYLLDDPLSAVDSHVGSAIFDMCIKGAMGSKTVVLVTNALQYLAHANNVLWMEDGHVRAQGTYTELVAQGLSFQEVDDDDDDEAEAVGTEGPDLTVESGEPGNKPMEALGPDLLSSNAREEAGTMEQGEESGKSCSSSQGQEECTSNLASAEEQSSVNLSWQVLKAYIQSGGGMWLSAALLAVVGLEQGVRLGMEIWVGVWFSDKLGSGLGLYLGVYAGLGAAYALNVLARSLGIYLFCLRAAVTLHNALLAHLMRLPKSFFDTNPAGRILNRFSRELDTLDTLFGPNLIFLLGSAASCLSICVIISISTKWFAIGVPPLLVMYLLIQRYSIPAARQLQGMESTSRSPIYTKFGEAVTGVATIRAYNTQDHFVKVSDHLIEANGSIFITQKLVAAWLSLRLEFLGMLVVLGCGFLVISGGVDPSLAGVALLNALDLTRQLKYTTAEAAKAETQFVSVERVLQYLEPQPEAEPETQPPDYAKALESAGWPSEGTLDVRDLTLRYRPDLPLVLRGVSFQAAAGEKLGIVGRTGSGKSSLILALYRMVECESGSVLLDGVDISSLGLRHLRSKLAIIPQDPFMFSGSVRTNLDPTGAYPDHRLWEVLETVGLKATIIQMEGKLDADVAGHGANFSQGTRQLFCLARALLRTPRLLMLDEATASMDLDTDSMVQEVLRTSLYTCTTLTIAHRLDTIMDSDRVLVLKEGRIVEDAHADDLLQLEEGVFSSMVSRSGRSSYLRSLAASSRSEVSFCGTRQRRSRNFSHTGTSYRLSYTSGADTPLAADSFMLNRHSAPTRRTHSDSGVRSSSGPHVKRPSMGGSISGRTSPFMEPHAETEDEEDMAREVEALRVCPGAFQLPPPSPGGLSGTSTPFSRTSWGGSTAGGSMSIRISGSGSGKQLRAPAEVCLALDSSPESSRPASPCRPQPRHGLRRALTGLAGTPTERHRSNLSRLLSHKLLSPAALDVVDESQHEGEGRGLEKRLSHRTRSLDLRSDSMRNGNA